MRRFGIVVGCVVWLSAVTMIVGFRMKPQDTAVITVMQPEGLVLPCAVQGVEMEAKAIAWYEGPFREDGSDEEVAGVSALIVTNTGDTMIGKGAVIMEFDDKRMVFEVFGLPAGETAMVLEKDQCAYYAGEFTACYGWESREYPEDMGHVTVYDAGGAEMLLTNRTNGRIPIVRVRYKTYDSDSDMYIGGICYEAEVKNLQPGEQRIITPYHFLCGSSKVISVVVEAE